MSAQAVQPAKYRERLIDFLGGQGRPMTLNEIRTGMRPGANHGVLRPVLEEMVGAGEVVRGWVEKSGQACTTWALAAPRNRIAGFVPKNGHANGHVPKASPPPIPDKAITFHDAKRIVEDLFLGIESLRVLAGQLELALTEWPNLPIAELIANHCEATGKDIRSAIIRDVLPLLVASEGPA